MTQTQVYQQISSLLIAIDNCKVSGNVEWEQRHSEKLEALVRDYLPSGSGFDNGTTLDRVSSTHNRLVFLTSYHHMTEGYYDGWTEHEVIVTASLAFGFNVRVTGRNRNDTKDYIAEAFQSALSEVVK